MFHRRSKTRPILTDDVWPPGVPRLYPHLSDRELSEFLPEDLSHRARRFPRVMILPFGSAKGSAREQLTGMALSRLLVRDLMLVRNLSVRGPEDTPNDFPPNPSTLRAGDFPADVVIAGRVSMAGEERYAAEVWIHRQGTKAKFTVPAGDVLSLTACCRWEILRLLHGEVDSTTEEGWRLGRPSSFEVLEEFGRLCLAKEDALRGGQALDLWNREPEFVLPLHLAGEDHEARHDLLEAMEYDPYDAQLCFLLFIAHWKSCGPQPEAVQFLRRAISLSPGHGKAHTCAPLAADPNAEMLRHSELGYRLLPGCPFAINNYILCLQNAGETERLKELAQEGLSADPYHPNFYDRLIEIFEAEGNYQTALGFAHRLLTLYEPAIHPRTSLCFKQNPRQADLLESGWHPAEELRKTIRRLSRLALWLPAD